MRLGGQGLLALLLLTGCGGPASSPQPAATISAQEESTTGPSLTAAVPSPTPAEAASPQPTAGAGHQIAFTREGPDGRADIFTMAPDGTQITRLTDDPRTEHDLFWLLDGSRLVFAWHAGDDVYHDSLASVLPDGSDRVELGSVQTAYSDPVVSPNGRYVAYGGDGDQTGKTGVIVLDLEVGTRTQLTTDGAGSPVWSPDSRRILAFAPSRLVVVIDVPSMAIVGTLADPEVQEVIGWTPDGASILFGDCEPGCGQPPVRIADADATNPRPYESALPVQLFDPRHGRPGVPSPDGKWIASVETERLTVWSAADGTGEPITPVALLVRGRPTWSPDGRWLAFSGATGAKSPRQIYVVAAAGGEPVPISSGPGDGEPTWQPQRD